MSPASPEGAARRKAAPAARIARYSAILNPVRRVLPALLLLILLAAALSTGGTSLVSLQAQAPAPNAGASRVRAHAASPLTLERRGA